MPDEKEPEVTPLSNNRPTPPDEEPQVGETQDDGPKTDTESGEPVRPLSNNRP